jgi:phosphoribosyl-ATP pyrophosphohydrolase/phosphoribosyl-AMP cyclohydrolase
MSSDGKTSGRGIDFLEVLDEVIRQRMVLKSPGSYVASLVLAGDKRLAQKLGEEAVELALAVAAGDRPEQLEEAADLLFHLLVLLNAKGIRLEEVAGLLERRHAARRMQVK